MGLIYGPSGCGKSSLVKAGLLPRLDPSVVKVYVEASGGDTEDRLLRNLRRQLPGLNERARAWRKSLAALRRGQCLAPGDKVLLVIDQFEQWLHANGGEKDAELVRALRQCDGIRVQCLVMVRDDFWLAVSRFMQALEVRVVEGENSRLVDLFDERHARKVLAALGHAFGALPEAGRSRKEQDAFLDQAVAGLAQDGKVVPVRLALFAEMVKGKPWTPAALREIGGAEGVGVAFLEETFSSPTAPPHHRLHQKTAQAVLAALLPEAGSDIKGHMRSREELLEASGCRNLAAAIRRGHRPVGQRAALVTPADPESLEGDGGTESSPLPPGDGQGVRVNSGKRREEWLGPHNRPSPRPSPGERGTASPGRGRSPALSRRERGTGRRPRGQLPVDPRLSRSFAADLADAETEGHAAGPGRTAAGRSGVLVDREAGEPPSSFALGVSPDSPLYAAKNVERSAAEDDGRRRPVSCLARAGGDRRRGADRAGGLRNRHGRFKANELHNQLFSAQIDKVPPIIDDLARYRRWLDPLLRQDDDEAKRSGDEARTPHRQSRAAARRRKPSRLPLRAAAHRQAKRSSGDPRGPGPA